MVRDAETHADEARKMREVAERDQAETLVYSTEKSLKEHRESLDEETISTIESRVADLRAALDGSDAGDIRKTEQLMEAAHKLAEAVYQRAQSDQAAPTGAAGNGEAPSDDEVVDEADYEVIDESEALGDDGEDADEG